MGIPGGSPMSRMVSQALLMSVKDTRIFFTNRFAVAFALAFPFLFILGFSLALSDLGPEDELIALFVATEDPGEIAREIVDGLVDDPRVRFIELDFHDALQQVENDELRGFLAIPSGFSDALLTGAPATIEVIVSSDHPETAVALRGVAASIAGIANANRVVGEAIFTIRAEAGAGLADLDLSSIPRIDSPVVFETEQVGDFEPLRASDFTLPGYLVMFVFFAAAMGAQEIARERETHTLERLMSNGVRRSAIILGKFLAGMYRGLMQLGVLWVVGVFAFGVDLGVSPATVVGVSVLMVIASSAFAVTLASLVKTRRAVDSAAVLVSLVAAPLGGSWWPLFITPDWMQALAKITPHGWANQAFNKLMMFGATTGDVVAEMGALVVFAVVFLAIALWRFRTAAP